jgi:hypothetical protein
MCRGYSVRGIRFLPLSIVGVILAVLCSQPVCAQVRVQGAVDHVRLEAHDATIEEILAALRAQFDVRYHGTALNRRVTATYEGPLRKILARVLAGYDYVIEPKGDYIEVVVLSAGAPRAAIPPAPIIRRRTD